jgi:23S rRNA (guanosine2251-2'-O)-methyltransferase
MGRYDKSKRLHRQKHADLGASVPRLSEEELIEHLAGKPNPLVLILDEVQDPHNLGACLRSADAAGARAVIAPRNNSASLTETARHVASGAAESVPFVQVTNLARMMEKLQKAGFWLVGTSDDSDRFLYDVDLTGSIGIVMGAEGPGLRRLTSEKCDHLVRIPMLGTVPCLNVSVAAGVCLFEAVRQRTMAGRGK